MSAVLYRQFINRDLPLRDRGCSSKAVFLSRREAKNVSRHGRGQDGSLRPYHCHWCDWWHIGHKRQAHPLTSGS